MELRTDLAVEAREIAGEDVGGVDFVQYSENGLDISRLEVKTRKARQQLGKEEGTYITVELPSLTDNFTETDERLITIGKEIRRLLPVNGLVLVVGLGNPEITPDSLGPKTSSRVLATRHISGEIARSTGLDRLRPVAVMATGVTGQTGIETGEYICGGQRPNIIDKPTPFKETLLLAESSMFGSSIASYRNNPGKTYVKSLFHAAYRREVFEKVGFFNEELVRTEDNEIHYRMRKAGYKLCFDPDIISYQYTRSSLKAMLKQKYANGYWIGKTSKVCPKCLSIYHFVPFAFVSAIIASGSVIGATGLAECIKKRHNHTLGKGISALRKVTVVLTTVMWVLYALMASGMAAVSAFKAEDKRNITNACLPVLFLLLHLSYGIGTIAGLMDKSKRG